MVCSPQDTLSDWLPNQTKWESIIPATQQKNYKYCGSLQLFIQEDNANVQESAGAGSEEKNDNQKM